MMKDYDVHVKLTLTTTHRVVAASLREAVVVAEKLNAAEIIPAKYIRESLDTDLEIQGVITA